MQRDTKKAKVVVLEEGEEEEEENGTSTSEQEEALIALIEHRTKEVDHLNKRLTYYKSQLQEAEKRLHESESQLARLRSQNNVTESKKSMTNGIGNVNLVCRSPSPHIENNYSQSVAQTKPPLLIPAVNLKIAPPMKSSAASVQMSAAPRGRAMTPNPTQSNSTGKQVRGASSRSFPEPETVDSQDKGTKRKFEQKEHIDLIPLIRKSSRPCMVRFHPSTHICSQHKRKLRSLALNPINDQLFATSALDGIVNLWQLQSKASNASLLSTTDCVSPKQRRWPEDITWHPQGASLFSVYIADGGDSQISVLNLNSSQEERVTFLEGKPHLKGIINSIIFMPWADLCFATGGSDHAVVLWNENVDDNLWKPKPLHRNLHSSAVMGVAGMQQKQIILSAGADKRIIGFDIRAGRADYKHQIESKCMSVLPNPSDFNLFMVQTGTPEKQLRLFDVRLRHAEIHAFGWKQESSESQSALINQAWSPDGLYITSGSADPMIHIFDIRYNSSKPSQSVKSHQKRVFKAVWHHTLPLLVSISSDLNIGLHRIS